MPLPQNPVPDGTDGARRRREASPVKKAKSRDVELHEAPPWLVFVLLFPRIIAAACVSLAALMTWFLGT